MNVAKPWCMVGLNPHQPDRETCSDCWPYWADLLERTAPRRQCGELHAHQPHDWQTSRMADPTMVCPGRATCDSRAVTIALRELPPQEGAISAEPGR